MCFNDVRDDPDVGVVILTGKLVCRYPHIASNQALNMFLKHALG